MPAQNRRFIATIVTGVALIGTVVTTGGAFADPRPGSTGKTFASAKPKTAAKPVAKATSSSARRAKTTTKRSSGAAASSRSLPGFGQGAKGEKVLALQTRLQELKYDVTPTGSFGYETLQAVLAFQKSNGLTRTGRVTDSVLEVVATATEPPSLIPTGGADRIEVDLERQFLMLYRDNALARIVAISSGSGKEFCVTDPETRKTECDKALTPGGAFRVRSRIIGWRESKLGLLYNPLYFNGGIAIHGAPVVPASPASHGCIRIPMPTAEWFHTAVPTGTPVYVFGGENAPVPLREKAPTDLRPNASAPSSTIDPNAVPVLPTTEGLTPTGLTPTGPTTTLVLARQLPTTIAAAPSTAVGASTTTGPAVAATLTVSTTLSPLTTLPGATSPTVPSTATATTLTPPVSTTLPAAATTPTVSILATTTAPTSIVATTAVATTAGANVAQTSTTLATPAAFIVTTTAPPPLPTH